MNIVICKFCGLDWYKNKTKGHDKSIETWFPICLCATNNKLNWNEGYTIKEVDNS